MQWNRKKTWLSFAIISAVYIVGHDLIFKNELKFDNLKEFINESKQHVWHIIPVVIAFLVLFIKDQFKK